MKFVIVLMVLLKALKSQSDLFIKKVTGIVESWCWGAGVGPR